jgi:hypothetical protein
MTRKFKRVLLDAVLSDQEDALWDVYYAEEVAARGLAPGDSLDTRNGVRVAAITTKYANVYRVAGQSGGVIDLDDRSQSWTGRTRRIRGRDIVLDTVGVDKSALAQVFQDAIP